MYLKASTDVKISTLLVENGGMRLWIMKWTFKLIAYTETPEHGGSEKHTCNVNTEHYFYITSLPKC